ncbi:unnamed protein product, partial [Iphiclides podalirius]
MSSSVGGWRDRNSIDIAVADVNGSEADGQLQRLTYSRRPCDYLAYRAVHAFNGGSAYTGREKMDLRVAKTDTNRRVDSQCPNTGNGGYLESRRAYLGGAAAWECGDAKYLDYIQAQPVPGRGAFVTSG